MSRKGENIYKRKDGRWEGRYIKGRRATGAIYYGYVYAWSYRDVKEKLIIKKATNFSNDATKEKFFGSLNDWCDYWLESVVIKQVKSSTFDSYKSKLDCHIRPTIGNIQLSELTPAHIEECIHEIKLKLSINSLHAVFRVLKTALKYAEKLRFIKKSLYENVKLPKIKKMKKNRFTQSEHKKLVAEARTIKNGLAILLSLETGMRIGEIAGLKWIDIDFKNKMVTVNRTLQRVRTHSSKHFKTKIIEGKPKSETSERTIPLSKMMTEKLLDEMKHSSSDYVISKGTTYTDPRTIRYQFKKIVDKLELPDCSFHALRHSFATRCLENGINIAVISALLGHSSVKMTLDIYTSSNLNEERNAVERIAHL